MIEEIKVLTCRCDGCHATLFDPDSGRLIYFGDEEELEAALEDQAWKSDKGTHLCDQCACERETGHALTFVVNQGSGQSCRCGVRYRGHVVVRDRLARV